MVLSGVTWLSILLSGCGSSLHRQYPVIEPVASVPSDQFKQYTAAHYFLSSWKNLPTWENDD